MPTKTMYHPDTHEPVMADDEQVEIMLAAGYSLNKPKKKEIIKTSSNEKEKEDEKKSKKELKKIIKNKDK